MSIMPVLLYNEEDPEGLLEVRKTDCSNLNFTFLKKYVKLSYQSIICKRIKC